MTPTRQSLSIEEIKRLGLKILTQSLGYQQKEAEVILSVLLYAELRGNSQGLIKLVTDSLVTQATQNTCTIAKETTFSAVVHGNKRCGLLVLSDATNLAIQKAKQHGVSVITVNDYYTTTGAIGYFSHQIGKQGLIGMVLTGSPELVAPYGSREPIFGTNPIAISFPRENKDSPLTMDLATSAISWFAIVLSKLAGQELPPGVAVDKKGHLTTNPAKALEGAILPFGGINSHKGSALALAVELFTNGLACGAIENKKQSQNWASFVLAIDPVCFHDTLEIFTRRIENILTRVKQAKKLLPSKEGIKKKILLPGERGDHEKKINLFNKSISLDYNLIQKLYQKAQEPLPPQALPPPKAPFSSKL